MIGLKDQCFGVEVEMTGITREQAAKALAAYFGTNAVHTGGGYDTWTVQDNEGNPVKGASVKVQRSKDGRVIELGETGVNGKISKDYLYYEEMTLTVTTPSGLSDTCSITLSAKNNSINSYTEIK